jgi:hypothetical protein
MICTPLAVPVIAGTRLRGGNAGGSMITEAASTAPIGFAAYIAGWARALSHDQAANFGIAGISAPSDSSLSAEVTRAPPRLGCRQAVAPRPVVLAWSPAPRLDKRHKSQPLQTARNSIRTYG